MLYLEFSVKFCYSILFISYLYHFVWHVLIGFHSRCFFQFFVYSISSLCRGNYMNHSIHSFGVHGLLPVFLVLIIIVKMMPVHLNLPILRNCDGKQNALVTMVCFPTIMEESIADSSLTLSSPLKRNVECKCSL